MQITFDTNNEDDLYYVRWILELPRLQSLDFYIKHNLRREAEWAMDSQNLTEMGVLEFVLEKLQEHDKLD